MTRCIRRSSRRSGRPRSSFHPLCGAYTRAGCSRDWSSLATADSSPPWAAASAWRSCPRPPHLASRLWPKPLPLRHLPPSRPCRDSTALYFFPIHSGRVRCARPFDALGDHGGSVPYRLRMASRLVRLRRKRVYNGVTEQRSSEREKASMTWCWHAGHGPAQARTMIVARLERWSGVTAFVRLRELRAFVLNRRADRRNGFLGALSSIRRQHLDSVSPFLRCDPVLSRNSGDPASSLAAPAPRRRSRLLSFRIRGFKT